MKNQFLPGLILLVLFVLVALNIQVSYAEPPAAPRTTGYEIAWWTVDGGGAQALTGGAFTLNGTAGQPDAGPPIIGGGYTHSGGFWVADIFGFRIHLPLLTR